MTSTADPTDSEALRARLRRLERELQAIRRVTEALHARTHFNELVRETLRVAIETVEASGGTVYLHDPARRALVFRWVEAPPEVRCRLQGLEMPDDCGIAGEVFHSGAGRIALDVARDERHNRDVDARTRYRTESTITVPLRSIGGRSLGVLQAINRRTGQFDAEDLAVLEILAAQAASAIETAQLHEEARRASVVQLIGDISHEVKNFLTPVVTGAQTLDMLLDGMYAHLDGLAEALPEPQREALRRATGDVREFYTEATEMIGNGARDVQERVREIADAIKGIVARPHFEPTDFRERAEAVARVLGLVAERRGVAIDLSGIEPVGPVEMDRRGIYNALYNLVNNAIPETPEGGTIRIAASAIAFRGAPGIEIRVEDTGRGMPEAVRERLFTEHAISTKPGGTGLGTRIVRNVVEAHRGAISVWSEPGRGTRFTLRLPARQAEEAPSGTEGGTAPGA